MTNTSNYAWNKPTNGADQDTWGTELNDTLDDIDAQMKLVEDKADAAQADADTLDPRVTTLEGKVLRGYASNFGDSRYFRGVMNEGVDYGDVAIGPYLYAVPFDHIGTFSYIGYYGSRIQGSTFLAIYDCGTNGLPGTRLVSAPYIGSYGVGETNIGISVTLTRPCWLAYFNASGVGVDGNVRLRGTTNADPPRWALGAALAPSAGSVPRCIVAPSHTSGTLPDPAPTSWEAPSYFSAPGWAPDLWLRP